MQLVYDEIFDLFYWQIDDRVSQYFDAPSDAWSARSDNRLIWKSV